MPPAEHAVRAVRVASYNTRDFLDDHHLAARIVRAVDPDVLCLQEVPRRLFGGWRVRRFARACAPAQAVGFTRHRVRVSPLATRLDPGESATFRISVSGPSTPGSVDDGWIRWRGARGSVTRIPVAITR